MKRPLALIGLTALLVLAVCFYAHLLVVQILAAVSLAGLILSLSIKKIRKYVSPVVLFAVVLLAAVGFELFSQLYVKPLQNSFGDEEHQIVATLKDEGKYRYGKSFYELQVKTVDGKRENFRIMLSSPENIICDVGDTLSFRGVLNSESYGGYLANRCYLYSSVYSESFVTVEQSEHRPPYYYAVRLRDKIRTAFYMELDYDNASLATAVMLGDNSGFTDDVKDNIRKAGLSHVTVVSGLHLSILTMMYMHTFGRLFKNKYISFTATFLLVLFFLCLTGFGKSSVRAALMLFVLMASRIFNRLGDSVNSLGLAAIVMCLSNPFVVGDIGVLLSYSATFGIVVFAQRLEDFLTKPLADVEESRCKPINKFLRSTASLFSCTFTAVLATLPVTVMFFGKVSLVQIVSNMVVVPFAQWFMLSASLAAVFHFVPYIEIVTEVFAFIADTIGDIMLGLTKFFASLPMAYVKADYEFVFFWMFSSIALLLLINILRRKGRGLYIIFSVMCVMILISGLLSYVLTGHDAMTMYVYPSYNGQAVILNSSQGNAILACSGKYLSVGHILKELDFMNTEGRLLVAASDDDTASENANNILLEFDYDKVLMYDKIVENTDSDNVTLCENDGTVVLDLWGKAALTLINAESSVYEHLSYGDTTVLILPTKGDVADIPEKFRNPDVLITSGIIDNMELLDFQTLISNGNDFHKAAVIDFYRGRSGEKIAAEETIIFDIVG